ncbi:MAG: NADH-quinone oxidoreductase subunit J [Hydrogenophaga sp.]|jgi:NADH-quinone oxidoreductase subunit J|uniref:NADH-quinone oxidoreductase subunit J n=1 Tax=Hydrogenophaga aromaticivorans TaxID=2610898 RepID=A0A7Y8KWV7_9BURK|nr:MULTISPECIES: NADH-quinone oxidoreductase subunit J [Hydrogenophaga]OGA74587.1 MAG: NADH:ubiquinone oxidoreductase subunit J [Burkholderiales bacterium GWE1_65_30]OGA94092.1 MAG: NADH:ubiquinone oxidoreductase subunit J [Burkholderiales bacterium GWF1_66_17]MBQ0920886.1 NADH-quinone oxidoreductase subunit J [Hydrogenophaga aromaticivorans]MDO9290322.1 NADH-quinone oxidoreductase subunit J [Hydrogenophaga sp.]MDP2021298.1 NADH-quinone oxidoreductase subunit J [Hydrogenophaga sp.]
MDYQTGFFYLFAAVLLFAAYRVVTAHNPVHAVLYLMLSFSQAAALWLLLKAEFLGLTLVLVYLGAVMVLFLFVVMMLDIKLDDDRWGFWQNFPLAAALGALVAVEIIAVLWVGFPTVTGEGIAAVPANYSNTKELGKLLYTEYLYPIEVAAVILLVAMFAAIALTLRQRKDSKAIDPGLQVKVRASDRLVVLPMTATQKAAPVALSNEEGQA